MTVSNTAIHLIRYIDEISTDDSMYSYRFIHQQRLEDGHTIGKDRVLKYMQVMGIQAIYPRKRKLTSIKVQEHKIYPYLLAQYHNDKKQVKVYGPDEVWSGDITYIRMNSGCIWLPSLTGIPKRYWLTEYPIRWMRL